MKLLFLFLICFFLNFCEKKQPLPQKEESEIHDPSFVESLQIFHLKGCPSVLLENPLGEAFLLLSQRCLKEEVRKNFQSLKLWCEEKEPFENMGHKEEILRCEKPLILDQTHEMILLKMKSDELKLFRCERTLTSTHLTAKPESQIKSLFLAAKDSRFRLQKESCDWNHEQRQYSLGLISKKETQQNQCSHSQNAVFIQNEREIVGFAVGGLFQNTRDFFQGNQIKLESMGIRHYKKKEGENHIQSCFYSLFHKDQNALERNASLF